MWPAASRVSQHRPRRSAGLIYIYGEDILADVDLDRRRTGRLQGPQPPRRSRTATLRLKYWIASAKIVRGANGSIVVCNRRKAEKLPGARVARDDLADRRQRQMKDFHFPRRPPGRSVAAAR